MLVPWGSDFRLPQSKRRSPRAATPGLQSETSGGGFHAALLQDRHCLSTFRHTTGTATAAVGQHRGTGARPFGGRGPPPPACSTIRSASSAWKRSKRFLIRSGRRATCSRWSTMPGLIRKSSATFWQGGLGLNLTRRRSAPRSARLYFGALYFLAGSGRMVWPKSRRQRMSR